MVDAVQDTKRSIIVHGRYIDEKEIVNALHTLTRYSFLTDFYIKPDESRVMITIDSATVIEQPRLKRRSAAEMRREFQMYALLEQRKQGFKRASNG